MNRAALVGLSCLVLLSASSPAAERLVPLPEGWRVHTEGLVVSDDRIAYSATQDGDTGEGRRIVRSRIVQVSDDGTVATDFPGKCTARQFTPDGRLLLAVLLDPEGNPLCEGCPMRAVLIDDEGREVWRSKRYSPTEFGFSTTGERLYAAGRCNDFNCAGTRIDVYDLEGRLVREIEPGRFLHATLLGDGSGALLVDEVGVRRIAVGESITTVWSRAFELATQPPQTGRLGADRLVLWDDRRRFVVIDADGVVLFEHDPARLAAADPQHDADWYRYAGVRPGPDGTIWLSHRGSDVLVDPDRGERRELTIDRTAPEGFTPGGGSNGPHVAGEHLVLLSAAELRVRPLWGDDGAATPGH